MKNIDVVGTPLKKTETTWGFTDEEHKSFVKMQREGRATMDDAYLYFNPIIGQNGEIYCLCHYQLIKHDDNTYRCTGISQHTYRFDQGTMMHDKFGRVMLAIPIPKDSEEDTSKPKTNKGKLL